MSRRPTPYTRFLGAQDPHERVDALGFFFSSCGYNNGSCGAPCRLKSSGQPYRMCDFHRLRHNDHQRSHVQRRVQPYRMRDADDALEDAARDPLALWSEERAFGPLMDALHAPPPPGTMAPPPIVLEILYEGTDGAEGEGDEENARNEDDSLDTIRVFLDVLDGAKRE